MIMASMPCIPGSFAIAKASRMASMSIFVPRSIRSSRRRVILVNRRWSGRSTCAAVLAMRWLTSNIVTGVKFIRLARKDAAFSRQSKPSGETMPAPVMRIRWGRGVGTVEIKRKRRARCDGFPRLNTLHELALSRPAFFGLTECGIECKCLVNAGNKS